MRFPYLQTKSNLNPAFTATEIILPCVSFSTVGWSIIRFRNKHIIDKFQLFDGVFFCLICAQKCDTIWVIGTGEYLIGVICDNGSITLLNTQKLYFFASIPINLHITSKAKPNAYFMSKFLTQTNTVVTMISQVISTPLCSVVVSVFSLNGISVTHSFTHYSYASLN